MSTGASNDRDDNEMSAGSGDERTTTKQGKKDKQLHAFLEPYLKDCFAKFAPKGVRIDVRCLSVAFE